MSLSPETLASIPIKDATAAAETAAGIIRQGVYSLPSLTPGGVPVCVAQHRQSCPASQIHRRGSPLVWLLQLCLFNHLSFACGDWTGVPIVPVSQI